MISCQGLFNKSKRKTISHDDLVPILVEIHKADALFNLKSIKDTFEREKSKYYYDVVLQQHGYTRKQLEATFTELSDKGEMFEKIYDEVIFELKKQVEEEKKKEEDRKRENYIDILPKDKARKYELPKAGKQAQLEMEIPLRGPGLYLVEADITMHKDDGSKNPQMKGWFYNKKTEKKSGLKKVAIRKDGKKHKVKLKLELKAPSATHFKLVLLSHDAKAGDWAKHVLVENIKVDFSSKIPDLKRMPVELDRR